MRSDGATRIADASPGLSPDAPIAEFSERELIARIRRPLPAAPAWMIVGIGDDAAVVETERNRLEVLSLDAIVEGVHFDRRFTPPRAIGHRALAVNLSDLAAMGAAPRLALVSLVLPPALPVSHFDGIVAGLTDLAAKERVEIAGGNLARSPGPIVVDITVVGTVKRRRALTRAGAKAGDELYVSGSIGAAAAGLDRFRSTDAGDAGAPAADDPLASAYCFPTPRVRLGVLLGRNEAASACMDLSDGLGDAVHQLAAASGVGATIEADWLPIHANAREWFAARRIDAIDASIAGGDDYELLIAVRPRGRRRFEAAVRSSGTAVTRIGVCTADREVLLRRSGQEAALPRGYQHFR
jgi:thiamine-monophosphate kinase